MFTIRDSHGDGLCCTQGNGEVTILYGSRKLSTPFENPASIWSLEFGTVTKCPPSGLTSLPTSSLTSNPTQNPSKSAFSPIASYDSILGAPRCFGALSPCTTVGSMPSLTKDHGLLSWKGNASPKQEANYPNTVDACEDGASGLYNDSNQNAESVESITVQAVVGNMLKKSEDVRITAKVWAYSTNDIVDFYLTEDLTLADWGNVLQSVPVQQAKDYSDISVTTKLLDKGLQAVRVIIRDGTVNGNTAPLSCPNKGGSIGTFTDTDDLVFAVDVTSSGGTLSSSGGLLGLSPLPVDSIKPISMWKPDCTIITSERCAFTTETCPEACNST